MSGPNAESGHAPDLPIRFEMRTADGTIVSVWVVTPWAGYQEPCELWRIDMNTGQRHRIRGKWEEIR